MTEIKQQPLGDAWVEYLRVILTQGSWLPDDREPIIEGPPVFLELNDARKDDPIIQEFGSSHIIEIYSRKMFSRELIVELNSTYGSRLFDWDGVDQVATAVDRLKKRWWSKSAAIGLIAPLETMPRVPCLINLLPLIRKNRLILNATFRSQNAFNSYGNFIGLRALQELIAKRLDVAPGVLRVMAYAPHIYESDIARASEIAGVPERVIAKSA